MGGSITDLGAEKLAGALKANNPAMSVISVCSFSSPIIVYDIGSDELSDVGATKFANVLIDNDIRLAVLCLGIVLNHLVGGGRVSDVGASRLAAAAGNISSQIRVLSICIIGGARMGVGGGEISDKGALRVAEALQTNPHISILCFGSDEGILVCAIDGDKMTDEGVKALVDSGSRNRLETLYLGKRLVLLACSGEKDHGKRTELHRRRCAGRTRATSLHKHQYHKYLEAVNRRG